MIAYVNRFNSHTAIVSRKEYRELKKNADDTCMKQWNWSATEELESFHRNYKPVRKAVYNHY